MTEAQAFIELFTGLLAIAGGVWIAAWIVGKIADAALDDMERGTWR